MLLFVGFGGALLTTFVGMFYVIIEGLHNGMNNPVPDDVANRLGVLLLVALIFFAFALVISVYELWKLYR